MAKKIAAADLESEVKKILQTYEADVEENVNIITKEVTQKGAAALRTESAATFKTTRRRKKKYAKTWTYEFEKKVLYSTGIIYNTQAGLPHLLENGHVKRNGSGRVEGREHIAKVDREVQRLYVEEVLSKL